MGKLILITGYDNEHLVKRAFELHSQGGYVHLWPEKQSAGEHYIFPQAEQFRIGLDYAGLDYTRGDSSTIVLATHSDHVFNGIRVGIKQGKLDHQLVQFRLCETGKDDIVLVPNKDARLDTWPHGFFDQLELALALLL